MKKIIILLLLIFFSLTPFASIEAYVNVRGYYRKDGTYVQPHVRSNPNGLKYDNYSYSPGQDLYNDTYGTRGSTWDTPTYITDPDYYVGKNLYENNTTLTLPSSQNTNTSYYNLLNSLTSHNCPSNSYYSYLNEKCICTTGYYSLDNQCLGGQQYCENKYGKGSYYDSLTENCHYCENGYTLNIADKTCLKQSTPNLDISHDSDNPLGIEPKTLIKNRKFTEVFYVDESYGLHWIKNEKAAEKNFGKSWNKNILEFEEIPSIYKFRDTIDND